MGDIGHNRPPDMTVTVREIATDLSNWMKDHPVIQGEDEAREAKVLIDRSSLGLKDMNDERDGRVRPLNEQVKEINGYYRGPRELLERVADELKGRIDRYLQEEERKRTEAAEKARQDAERAEQAARDAERFEGEQIAAAEYGTLDVDVGGAIEAADRAFAAYKKAEHQAQIAERDTNVRIGGGFRRALSLKSRTIIIVDDPIAAIKEIGLGNEEITEAITKAARAYKKIMGRYPAGIRVEEEKSV